MGDSRICLWRNGGLIQLNQEHNFHHDLTLLALQGDLELEEADRDPRRESLTSYIGRGFPRSVEWNPEPIQLLPGDQILLASDGVYRALSQNELANCLQECTAQKAVQSMHAMIQEKALSNQDNYTGVVLRLGWYLRTSSAWFKYQRVRVGAGWPKREKSDLLRRNTV